VGRQFASGDTWAETKYQMHTAAKKIKEVQKKRQIPRNAISIKEHQTGSERFKNHQNT
jgi:hypothetical protein